MKKRTMRVIGAVMILIAIAFLVYAVRHPEASFPWSNEVTYAIYRVWCAVIVFLLVAPFGKRE